MNNFSKYIAECYEMQEIHPSWRWGQTLFNTLHMMSPNMANEIRGTDVDPYYAEPGDGREMAFWDWIAERLG